MEKRYLYEPSIEKMKGNYWVFYDSFKKSLIDGKINWKDGFPVYCMLVKNYKPNVAKHKYYKDVKQEVKRTGKILHKQTLLFDLKGPEGIGYTIGGKELKVKSFAPTKGRTRFYPIAWKDCVIEASGFVLYFRKNLQLICYYHFGRNEHAIGGKFEIEEINLILE